MKKPQTEAQNPLILRSHRLMDAFAKSDDERDFYLNKNEGFMVYVDLDKSEDELKSLMDELNLNPDLYCMIPKLTFYETKKIMEGFIHEKVYDIDTKEKLLDIIQSKEPREHFLEFIHDHHTELEKWQQYFQERSRIRIIEWLRQHNLSFVFEEDLDLAKNVVEELKESLFEPKVSKDLSAARQLLSAKAKTYYSNEALNPRPKRGRPPKQTAKVEIEPQVTADIYHTVPPNVRHFVYKPDITNASEITFSAKYENEQAYLAHIRSQERNDSLMKLEELNKKLATLKALSEKMSGQIDAPAAVSKTNHEALSDEFMFDDEEDDFLSKYTLPKPITSVAPTPKVVEPKLTPKPEAVAVVEKPPTAPAKAAPKAASKPAPKIAAKPVEKPAPKAALVKPVAKSAKPAATKNARGRKSTKRTMQKMPATKKKR